VAQFGLVGVGRCFGRLGSAAALLILLAPLVAAIPVGACRFLPESDLERLLRSARYRLAVALVPLVCVALPCGKLREGEGGLECFIILSGTATVSRKGETITTLGAGEVLGELAPLTGGPRNATAVADTAMDLLIIGEREFSGLLEEVPGFAVRVLRNLAQRMTDSEEADGN
jgi:CRP-like cAMP-binding protein